MSIAHPSADARECEVVVVGENVRFARLAKRSDLLMVVSSLLKHAHANHVAVQEVRVNTTGVLSCALPQDVYYTNICGKVDHYDVCAVVRDEVAVYVKEYYDAFGSAFCMYSPLCSLRISKAMTNTLYRGGCCSLQIARVLDHALKPETIHANTVHMIVASARLGHPVLMHHDFLAYKLCLNSPWKCTRHVNDGEMQKYHSLKLHGFDLEWLAKCGLQGALCPQSCLVNVCRTGTVNLFLSISPGVPFEIGIEHCFTRMLQDVVSAVAAGT